MRLRCGDGDTEDRFCASRCLDGVGGKSELVDWLSPRLVGDGEQCLSSFSIEAKLALRIKDGLEGLAPKRPTLLAKGSIEGLLKLGVASYGVTGVPKDTLVLRLAAAFGALNLPSSGNIKDCFLHGVSGM